MGKPTTLLTVCLQLLKEAEACDFGKRHYFNRHL